MSDLTFVQSDDAPSVSGILTDAAGVAINLTTATSVRFQMRLLTDYRFTVDALATVVSPATGSVRYDWAAGDLVTAGDYEMRWRILWGDGSIQHSDPANTITVAAQ